VNNISNDDHCKIRRRRGPIKGTLPTVEECKAYMRGIAWEFKYRTDCGKYVFNNPNSSGLQWFALSLTELRFAYRYGF